MKQKTNITVVDSVMGSSKTSHFIEYMKKNSQKRFIYITPFLEEVKRVLKEVPKAKQPYAIKGKKLAHLKELIIRGETVCTTHSLLSKFDREVQEALEVGEYELILDEVAEVVHPFNFDSKSDEKTFFEDLGGIDEEGYLYWDKEKNPIEEYQGRYQDIMILCENKNLMKVGDKLFMWELPINIFNKFSKVFILTYLFKGSYQKSYFDMYGVDYNYMCMKNKELAPYEETSKEERLQWKELINVIENDRLNSIGEVDYSLSSTWYKSNVRKSGKETVFSVKLKNHLENYFNKICKGKTKDNLWSTYKDYKSRIKGKGYTKGFLEYNTRATNEYRERSNLAYMLNLYPHTSMVMYFNEKDINVDRDSYALGILLQWIWRSRIRNYDDPLEDRKINLYLPSLRMRMLLYKWLEKA